MTTPAAIPFRFDADRHEYTEVGTGSTIPHITGLLQASGWVDDRWMTEESCVRGTAVHELTARFDLGMLDPATCVSVHRGYLLAHVKAMGIMKPDILSVEEPSVHPTWRFGGRPDREVIAWGLRGVLEGKSGVPAKSHMVQTALQAILVSGKAQLPPEAEARFALYWKANGKFVLEEHKDRRDFDEAYRILRRYAA